MTEENWDFVIDVNLKGTYNEWKAVYKPMSEQKYVKVVSLSSRAYLGNFGQANYSAAKAGIVGLGPWRWSLPMWPSSWPPRKPPTSLGKPSSPAAVGISGWAHDGQGERAIFLINGSKKEK